MGLTVNQRDVFLANLNPVKGHEQAGLRPVLVLQNDVLNERLSTTIVVPITKNLSNKGRLTTYYLSKDMSGLGEDSLVLLFQIRTLDKTRLLRRIAQIPSSEYKKIQHQLSFVF